MLLVRHFGDRISRVKIIISTVSHGNDHIILRSYSDKGGKDGKDGSTIPVAECTQKQFTQPQEKECPDPCLKRTSCLPSEVPKGRPMPCECVTDIPKGPCYDPDCRRPYVNPCSRDYKPCFPVPAAIKYDVKPCGRPNLMDSCPVPDCPYVKPTKLSKLQKLLLLLAALAVGGVIYKAVDVMRPPKLEQKEKKKVKAAKERVSKRPQVIHKIPSTASEIPSEIPYLIVGGGTAAHAAFKTIVDLDPDARVLVISNEPYYPYIRPPLCKQMVMDDDRERAKELKFGVGEKMKSSASLFLEDSSYYTPVSTLDETCGVGVARGWHIVKIDPVTRTAYLDGGKEIKYGKCLIASGSYPKNIPVFEEADDDVKERVTLYKSIFDFQELDDIIEEGAKSIVVIGGGFLGSEIACALAKRGKKKGLEVYQIVKEKSHLIHVLPPYLSEYLTTRIVSQGVRVLTGSQIEDAKLTKNRLNLILNSGCEIMCDQAIVAVGAQPNTDIAEDSGLEVCCKRGGYLVNTEMELRSDLYAAGDCACYFDMLFGRRRVAHHRNAVLTGEIAGKNMTGDRAIAIDQAQYGSGYGSEIGFEAVGVVCSKLPTVGVFTRQVVDQVGGEEDENGNASKPMKFDKGVVFYFKDDIIVGMLFWNLYGKTDIAKLILKAKKRYEDVDTVAKLFEINK